MEMNTIRIFPMGSIVYFYDYNKIYCGRITEYRFSYNNAYGSYLIENSNVSAENVVEKATWVSENEVRLTEAEAEVLLYQHQIKQCANDIDFMEQQINDYKDKLQRNRNKISELEHKIYTIMEG